MNHNRSDDASENRTITDDAGEKTATVLVVETDAETAVVRDVTDGRIYTLADQPDAEMGGSLAEDEILEATIRPQQPLELAWELGELHERRSIAVERSSEPPTARTREIAAGQDEGGLTRVERAGTGEIHVLSVAADRTESAIEDILDDGATRERAARLGVARVEVRAADGVVGVRYLP